MPRLVSKFLKVVRVVGEQRAGRQGAVSPGDGDDALAVIVEALGAQSLGARSFALRIAVVRRAFPRGDDNDLNMRAPRHGPGRLLTDSNVRVPADSPGLAVWSRLANRATQEEG